MLRLRQLHKTLCETLIVKVQKRHSFDLYPTKLSSPREQSHHSFLPLERSSTFYEILSWVLWFSQAYNIRVGLQGKLGYEGKGK